MPDKNEDFDEMMREYFEGTERKAASRREVHEREIEGLLRKCKDAAQQEKQPLAKQSAAPRSSDAERNRHRDAFAQIRKLGLRIALPICGLVIILLVLPPKTETIMNGTKKAEADRPRAAGENAMPSEFRLLKGGKIQLQNEKKTTELTGTLEADGKPKVGVDYPLILKGKDAEGVGAVFRGTMRFDETNVSLTGSLEITGFVTNALTNVIYVLK